MTAQSSLSSHLVREEHRGWKLQARWFSSLAGVAEGWVCYVTGPGSSHELNIGRWDSSAQALEHGRQHVDRRLSAPMRAVPARHAAPAHLVRLAA